LHRYSLGGGARRACGTCGGGSGGVKGHGRDMKGHGRDGSDSESWEAGAESAESEEGDASSFSFGGGGELEHRRVASFSSTMPPV
jgi:hypothetical protein